MSANIEQNDRQDDDQQPVSGAIIPPESPSEGDRGQLPPAKEQITFNYISSENSPKWYQGWKFEKKDVGTLIAIITLIFLAYQSWELRRTNEIATKSLKLADSAFVETRKSGEETSIRMDRAVQAIEKSANAMAVQANAAEQTAVNAKKSIEIAEMSARISNRAYLSMVGVTPTAMQPGKKFEATVQFVINGKTPAYQVHHVKGAKVGGTGIYEHEIDEVKKLEKLADLAMGTSIPVSFTVETRDVIGQEESAEIMSGEKAWYVFGRITYVDIFREKHYTRYCFVLVPGKTTFESYHRYNDAN